MVSASQQERFDPPPGEPRRSQRLSILDGMVSSVQGACIGGSILTAYALGLGASDFHLGLIAGLTTVANIGLIAGARMSLWLKSRKRVVVPAAFISRALWVLLIFVPFLPAPISVRVWTFLAVLLVTQVLFQAAVSPWSDWIADLVPESTRGRFFGMRNALCGAAGMLAALAAGRSFDRLRAHALPGLEMRVFIPFFLVSAALAVVAAGLVWIQWDPPTPSTRPPPPRDWLLRPLRHPSFRSLIRFQMLWAFACSIAGPFFAAHMIRNLHMSMSAIAMYGVIAGSVALLTQPAWGRIADRFGNRPVLVFNLIAVVLLPGFWFFATPGFLTPIWVDAWLTGLCWPGLNLALFNLVLGTAPAEERQGFLATQGVLVGLSNFIAAATGGWVAAMCAGFSCRLGSVTLVNFHLLFGLSVLARLSLLPLAMRLHEPRAMPVRALISGIMDARYRLSGMIMTGMEQTVAILRRRDRPR